MIFRTEVHITPSENKISHRTPLLLLGSCFTDNIGSKLRELCFPVFINPCGIVYNPVSVKRSLDILIDGPEFSESDLGNFNDLWYSFDHHTSFSHPEKNICLEKINQHIREGREQVKKASYILVTYGTSRIYTHKKLKRAVSNCHKIPASEFEQHMLNTDEIVNISMDMVKKVTSLNPDIKFIFTVSPVRHWKDGAVGNQLSKAALIIAIHHLIEHIPSIASYFPAYELMLDDLRDYRFYADDLLHPGSSATQYIWEKFAGCYFTDETLSLVKELTALNNALNHRPFNKNKPSWKTFLWNNKEKTETLSKKFPFLDLTKYFEYFT